MHGNRRPDHRLAEGPAGLRRVRDLRLQRHRPHRPRAVRPPFASAAGRDGRQRRHRHVHAAVRTSSSFESTLTGLVHDGTVPMARIDDAVSRILTKKFELGLFEHPYTDRTHLVRGRRRGAPRGRAPGGRGVAGAAEEPTRATLPLGAAKRPVYVAGSNADNIGNQAGGWTLTWQGGSTNVDPRHRRSCDGHPGTTPRRRSRSARTPPTPVPHERRRRRRRRRDAVRRGLRRRRRSAVGLRPGRQRRAAPAEDHAALRRGHGRREHGLRRRPPSAWCSWSPAGR